MGAPSGDIPAYLADPANGPAAGERWPGVVVVHDAFGLTDDVRAIAERFATGGYLALVPDLYARGGLARCVKSVFTALRAGSGPAVQDILAARQTLSDRPDCTGKVGVVGFCMGGGFALVTAPMGFDAAAPYYGELPGPLPAALAGSCPVVGSYGGRDRTLKGAADRLDGALGELGITRDIVEYPQAGHAFANRIPFGPLAPLARVVGMSYEHDAAEDAWRRVFAFFGAHLTTS